jgi:hypothetical protein
MITGRSEAVTKIYRLRDEAFAGHMIRAVIKLVIFFGIVVALIIWKTDSLSAQQMTMFLVLAGGAFAIGVWNAVRMQRNAWRSYELVVCENEIRRRTAFLPDIVIGRSNVTKVTQNRRGSITIHGSGKTPAIGVPAAIEGRAELLAELGGICPVETKEPVTPPWLVMLVVVGASLAGFVGTFLSKNRAVVVPVGIVTGTGWFVCAVIVMRSQHVDRRVRRAGWLMVWPVLAAYARVILFW